MADQEVDLDSIIDRLLEVRGSRPGKQVQLLESEIRYLCTKSREIFISQPILLELEAPIKVCNILSFFLEARASSFWLYMGFRYAGISTVNITISYACLNMADSRRKQITSFSGIMWTVASNRSRPSAFFSRIRSSIRKTFLCCVATTNARRLTGSTASTMNASDGITSSFGRRLPIASIACR